ncbi:MAG TPA: vitamin K epoxide reductase family protein [Candidatus Angelobacter sp.]
MRWIIAILALAGMMAAILALREHYRTEGQSPCSINERWDCGSVNKSRFASIGGVFDHLTNRSAVLSDDAKPRFETIRKISIADVGIAGYILLGLLALMRRWQLLAAAAVLAFGFSCYLAYIEKYILEKWCIYCVISWGIITLITLLSVIALVMDWRRSVQSRESTA